MRKKLLLMLLGVLVALPTFARDFEYTYEGQTLTYTVISEEDKTVVTKSGSAVQESGVIHYYPGNNVSGELIIPEIVKDVDIEYSVTEIGFCAFSGCRGLTSVTIPESVTSIGGYAFWYCNGLTSVTIPESVTSIGEEAFGSCSGLTKAEFASIEQLCSIEFGYASSNPLSYAKNLYINGEEIKELVIPESVESIGNYAFYGCSGLTSVIIGNSVTSIGNDAFKYCRGLTSVTIGNSVTSIGNSVTSIGKSAFSDCSSLRSVTIGNSVESIGAGAFGSCSALTSVIIGNSVETIGDEAFYGCGALKDLTIEDGQTVLSLGTNNNKGLFSDCPLKTLYLGRDLNYNTNSNRGYSPFYYKQSLTEIVFGNTVTSIGEYAFVGCSGLTSVTIPNSVTSIGNYAFGSCNGLTSVIIGNSVTSIGTWAFHGCSSLVKSAYPNNLYNPFFNGYAVAYQPEGAIIENRWIYGPEKKEIFFAPYTLEGEFIIPESVTSIGSSAFYGCSDLTSVIIGNSVTSIGQYAFSDCSGLQSVIALNEKPATIDESSFEGLYETTELTVPTDAINAYLGTNWSLFKNIRMSGSDKLITTFSDDVLNYRLIPAAGNDELNEAVIISGNYSGEISVPERFTNTSESGAQERYYVSAIGYRAFAGSEISKIEFNSRIKLKTIGDESFYGCKNLTSIAIPESVESIGSGAFYGCNGLTSVTIPNSVTSIGNETFFGCNGLTSVTIPNSVTSIGSGAFYGCNGLTSVTIPNSVTSIGNETFFGCRGLTSATIGHSVISIGYAAFRDCSGLTSVTIPNSVTSIGNYAFGSCSGLTKAEFASIEQLCSIEFGNYWSNPLSYAKNLYINGEEIKELVIPNSVTSIGNYAFFGCRSLESVLIPGSVNLIGSSAFMECNYLQKTEFASIASICNINFGDEYANPLQYTHNLYVDSAEVKNLVVPESVTSIGNYAFISCSGLESIDISSAKEIGVGAFSGCSSVKFIKLGAGIENIEASVFDDCVAITELIIADGETPISLSGNWLTRISKLYMGREVQIK